MAKLDQNGTSYTALGLIAGALIGIGIGIYLSGTNKDFNLESLRSRLGGEESEDAEDDQDNLMSSLKTEIGDSIDNLVSDLSHQADDVIVALEKKLAELKKKNAQFQK